MHLDDCKNEYLGSGECFQGLLKADVILAKTMEYGSTIK